MKKNIYLGLFFVLAVLAGLMLSSCEQLEEGIGTIKLTNNSTNVRITYWCIEKSGSRVWETQISLSPGYYTSRNIDTGFYTIYLEDNDGDGWVTKNSFTVKKDETVEVKFPGDFKVSN
jgi:hypothetical protein